MVDGAGNDHHHTGVFAMFPTDVLSVHALRVADLLVAAQAREHREVVRPGSGVRPWHRLVRFATPLSNRVRSHRDPQVATYGPLSASHELFDGLISEQLAEMGRHLSIIDVQPGHTLGQQGAPARNFVTVLDGNVGVTIDGVPHAVLDAGTHFGAVPLLDNPSSQSRATFTTMTPSRVAVANPRELREILDLFPVVAQRIYLMTQVRREFLVDLARADRVDTFDQLTSDLHDYPEHLSV
jgi:CRP-like cAMP-binding protein